MDLPFLEAKNEFIEHNNVIYGTFPFNEGRLGYAYHSIQSCTKPEIQDLRDDFKEGANDIDVAEILHVVGVSTLEIEAILAQFILSNWSCHGKSHRIVDRGFFDDRLIIM